MRYLACIQNRYLFDTGVLQRFGVSKNAMDVNKIIGIGKGVVFDAIRTKEEAKSCDLFIYNPPVFFADIEQLTSLDERGLVLILHFSEKRELRRIYNRLADKFPEKRILYYYANSDRSLFNDFLIRLHGKTDDYQKYLDNFESQQDNIALETLKRDFSENDFLLEAYDRFFNKNDFPLPLPYLWRRLFDNYPKLFEMVREHDQFLVGSLESDKVRHAILNYLYP